MPVSIGGQTYSDQQVKDFYANGGNERQFLEQNGITDLWGQRDLTLQARGIAGPGTMAGDAGLQNYFKQYQQYNPGGANVNNYSAWVADQNPHSINAMRAGTYTGAAISPVDYDPNGIYGSGSGSYKTPGFASGLGPRGDGGGWDSAGGSVAGSGGSGGSNFGMGGGSGGSSGYSSSSSSGNGPNPYLGAMADDIARRSNQALGTNLSGIRGQSIGVGGMGGSRQGVAEGVAIGNSQDSLQGNLANLYGGDWTNQQNRDLQRYGIDTNASLTNQGQWQNFYTAQRGQDMQGLQLGANLYGQGNAGYTGQGQGIYNIGNTQQQAPWQVQQNANGSISPYTGYGSSSTTSGSAGGGVNGYVGGALAGAQIGKNLGLGGGSSPSEPYPGYNASIGF